LLGDSPPPHCLVIHPQGLFAYDEVFDGRFIQALADSGGNLTTQYPSIVMHHPASGIQPWLRHNPVKENITVAICTRHMFETTARKLLGGNPRVQFVYGLGVTGLLFEDGGAL
jgi:hypothetical protein